ncbi:MAG: type IV secretory system conjugative DNA transfer family protein [Bacteroidia bacterium]|nr:type IV secretory system conjugative DNA transfer family protein [Bacteroidia bacterium]
MENAYSVNFQTQYIHQRRQKKGWINVVNPFRAVMVMGTPGSGKSFAVLIPAMKQMIEKGFTMYVYDFKFPDLTEIAYNALRANRDKYDKPPRFFVINFDDPRRSHRCNPIHPKYIRDMTDCYESARVMMMNLNRSWITKQGDFFVESPINFLTAVLGFLWKYEDGRYCTFPHAIEFLNLPYDQIFPILGSYPELENYANPFISAYQQQAEAQLEGQIASAKIGLGRLSSPLLYWTMSGDDFSLDINNPDDPKILCVGNNPEKLGIYGAALGLYNATLVRLINKKKQLPCALVVDELPTIYFKGLDTLIATARSNKIATWLGLQDLSQLIRDYGEKEAKVIVNTVGSIFSGQVVGQTAKYLQDRFGKVERRRESTSKTSGGKGGTSTSRSTSTQQDYKVPEAEISNISQGYFVGSTADNFGEEVADKVFHAKIVVDTRKLAAEEAASIKLPPLADFGSEAKMGELLHANYARIKAEVKALAEARITEIKDDPAFAHLFLDKGGEPAAPDLPVASGEEGEGGDGFGAVVSVILILIYHYS